MVYMIVPAVMKEPALFVEGHWEGHTRGVSLFCQLACGQPTLVVVCIYRPSTCSVSHCCIYIGLSQRSKVGGLRPRPEAGGREWEWEGDGLRTGDASVGCCGSV